MTLHDVCVFFKFLKAARPIKVSFIYLFIGLYNEKVSLVAFSESHKIIKNVINLFSFQAVKLESVHSGRTRYLVVVSCIGRQDAEECCLLGIDCNEKTTVGLVLRVLADTTITLDGDGGFSVCVCGRQHIFKPVSVQAMW